MKLIRFLHATFCVCLIGTLAACDRQAEVEAAQAAPSVGKAVFNTVGTNPQDGCTVVRFYRHNERMYDDTGFYTRCDKQVTTEYDVSCGKSCTNHVTITTIGEPDAESK